MARNYTSICAYLDKCNKNKEFEEVLFSYDFPSYKSPYRHLWLVGLCFFLPAAIIVFFALPHIGTTAFNQWFSITTTICATGGLVLTMLQWITARRESSLDKYYDRLEYANKRLQPFADDLKMYVYMELDNLEYVIEKYKLGFISHEQAFRGLNAFIRHCIASEHKYNGPDSFIDHAQHATIHSGYHHSTKQVIYRIIKELEAAPLQT